MQVDTQQPVEQPKQEAVAADFMAAKPKVKAVWSEGLGKIVWLRAMTAADKDEWNAELVAAAKTGSEMRNVTARLLVRCICDGGGNLMFKPSDAVELGKSVDARILEHLAGEALNLCGLTPKAVEEVAGN